MSAELREGRRLVEAAADPDPEVRFAAVVALPGLVEVLEALQVDNARACGRSPSNSATGASAMRPAGWIIGPPPDTRAMRRAQTSVEAATA
jgi:hypothetical protein